MDFGMMLDYRHKHTCRS